MPRLRFESVATLVVLFFLATAMSSGQAPPVQGGLPAFSTFDVNSFVTVNLSNLNVHLDIPLRSTPGRGIPFHGHLVTDTVWGAPTLYPNNGDVIWGGPGTRFPINSPSPGNFGGMGFTGGYLFSTATQKQCTNGGTNYGNFTVYSNFSYIDNQGTTHYFPSNLQIGSNIQGQTYQCSYFQSVPNTAASYPATDGTPYQIHLSPGANAGLSYVLNIATGVVNDQTDADGNSNSFADMKTLIDSSGNQAMLATGTITSSGYTDTYSYTGSDGLNKQVVATVTKMPPPTITIGCPNVLDPPYSFLPGYLTGNPYLLTNLAMADGTTSYSFTYDSLIRPHVVTLPTGGQITFNFNGAHNGVSCEDGGGSGFTETTPDGTWTYSRVFNQTTQLWTTTVTDPQGNMSAYTFGGSVFYSYSLKASATTSQYETQRLQYQKVGANQVLMKTAVTCYNGNFTNCATDPTPTKYTNGAIVAPFQKDVYTYLPGVSAPSVSETTFNNGIVTQDTEYDFGGAAALPNPPGSNFISRRTVTLGAYTCTQSDVTTNSAGTILAKTTHVCNGQGHPTSESRLIQGSNYATTGYTYYSTGLVKTTTNPNTTVTTYTDNACNGSFPTNIAVGSLTTTMTWDCNGEVPLTVTDANSQVTTYKYNDPLWRRTEIDYPDGGSTTYSYTDAPPASVTTTTVIDNTISPPYTTSSRTVLDGLGRVSQEQLTTDPQGTDYTDITYDHLGRVLKQSNPHRSSSSATDGTTTYLYDALGRVCLVVPPDITTVPTSCPTSAPLGDVFTSYSGACATVTDQSGHSRKSCRDGLGRVTQVFEDPIGLNYETDYGYDALNNLVSVTQNGSSSAIARLRTFTYDSLSRLLCASNPETSSARCTAAALNGYITGTTGYNYDANGNVSKRTAPLHNQNSTATVTTTYNYDALDRLISKTYSDGTASVQFGYDGTALSGCATTPPSLSDPYPHGRRTAMCDGSGATSWTHDQMGRIASEARTIKGTATVTKTTTYQYNVDGSLNELTYASGTTLNYAYDQAQRQNFVADLINNIGYVDSATFAPPGPMTGYSGASTSTFSGITNTFNYNNRLQPTGISANTSASTIFSLGYTYGPTGQDNGNISTITNNLDATRTVNFNYDSLNRIANALTTNWGEAYVIDAWGNMTAINSYQGKAHENLSCGPANTQNQLNTCYGYDSAGNLVANGSATYTYDGENRLVGTAGWTYVYDGDGNRVRKFGGSNGTLYWPDTSGNVLGETDQSGNPRSDYVFFNGQRIARFDPKTLAVHYYFSNHLGSHVVVTNATGTCEQDIEYYPYGGQRKQYCGTPVAQNYKFTGKERDSESGLDNFGARYNASTMGRFMTPDPMGGHQEDPQTLNRYSYVRNNPLNLTDPKGLDFYLQCTSSDHSGCTQVQIDPNSKDKTWVQADSNKNATVVTSDSIRNGDNSATVNQNGVQITTGGQTYQGVYFDNPSSHTTDASGNDVNHNPITLQGDASKGLGGFSFNVNGNCGGTCLSAGSVQFSGTPDQARAALNAAGAWNYGFWDTLNSTDFGHHPFTDQFRFGGPGPSLHVSVPWDYLPNVDAFPTQNPFSTVPMTGGFHTDATTGSSHFWCANFGVGCN